MRAVPDRESGSTSRIRRARFDLLFADVYEPLQRYVRRRSRAADADDVVADALLVAWRCLDEIPADATVAWMYGVARNCLANRHRSAARSDRLALRIADDERTSRQPTAEAGDPELEDALIRLGDLDREVIRLWAWEQLTPAEIAVVMGTTPNATSIRLHRAKQRLAEILDEGRKKGDVDGHQVHEHGEEER